MRRYLGEIRANPTLGAVFGRGMEERRVVAANSRMPPTAVAAAAGVRPAADPEVLLERSDMMKMQEPVVKAHLDYVYMFIVFK